MNYNPRWPGAPGPNLTKLPQHIREQIAQPVPLRPSEVRTKISLFQVTSGLQHPNGRVLVSEFRQDPDNYVNKPDGIQIDGSDFYGRKPLLSIVLDKKTAQPVIENMLRCFLALGATKEELAALVSRAEQPLERLQATTYYEDEGSRD